MFGDFGDGSGGLRRNQFQKIFRKLSLDRPGALRTDAAARAGDDPATQAKLSLARVARDHKREPVRVDVQGALRRTARKREADALGASLASLGRGAELMGSARSALSALRVQVGRLAELAAEAAATTSTTALAGLASEFDSVREDANAVVEQAGAGLLDGALAGTTTVTVLPTAARGRAADAQTSKLARDETIEFKSYGIFDGLTSSERRVTLAKGDTQEDVVAKINTHTQVSSRVRARVGEDGRLVIEARQSGSGVSFRFDSSRSAASDSSGIGRTNITSDAGSDDASRAASVTALVAQTQGLTRNESITFKSYGVFKGLTTNERRVTLSKGDSQADVVRKINAHASVSQWVEASTDAEGRLVLTSRNSGTPHQFKVDASRSAAANTTGLGTADIVSAGATDGENRAAFVRAAKAQTGKLERDETIRFKDEGIFAGLSRGDRELTVRKGATQSQVIDAINRHTTIGSRVVASTDAAGRLVISGSEIGAHVHFRVDSTRGARSSTTGIGTGDLQAHNGVTIATQETHTPGVVLGSNENGFALSIDTATLEALGIDDLDLSDLASAQAAVTTLEEAIAKLDAQADTVALTSDALDRSKERLSQQEALLREQALPSVPGEEARGARAQTLKNATSAVLLHTNLEPSLALHLLR